MRAACALAVTLGALALTACSSDPGERARFIENLSRLGAGMQIDSPRTPDRQAAPAPSAHACFASHEWVSGMLKNCAYRCLEGEAVKTIGATELCPLTLNQ